LSGQALPATAMSTGKADKTFWLIPANGAVSISSPDVVVMRQDMILVLPDQIVTKRSPRPQCRKRVESLPSKPNHIDPAVSFSVSLDLMLFSSSSASDYCVVLSFNSCTCLATKARTRSRYSKAQKTRSTRFSSSRKTTAETRSAAWRAFSHSF